jgi:transposase
MTGRFQLRILWLCHSVQCCARTGTSTDLNRPQGSVALVAVKSEAKQAAAVIFRARDLLVGQRTQIINALRGHLAEYGVIAPQGPSHVARLVD